MTPPASVTRRVTVTNKLGLHARAAAKLVKVTGGFDSEIKLCAGDGDGDDGTVGNIVDAKSIMQVMMLAATEGSELTLTADGADAAAAAAAVCALFADKFGEGE